MTFLASLSQQWLQTGHNSEMFSQTAELRCVHTKGLVLSPSLTLSWLICLSLQPNHSPDKSLRVGKRAGSECRQETGGQHILIWVSAR